MDDRFYFLLRVSCQFFYLRLHPLVVFLDEVNEAFHRFGFGDVKFDWRLADVEIDLVRRAAHVAEVRIRHFAGAIHDAAHDAYF